MKIHDRYILRGFWQNLLLGLIAFTVIFITVDVSEEIDNYIDHDATIAVVTLYYVYLVPWILTLVLPVAVLLAVVFSLGKLSRQNELTAFIASGRSYLRVAAPIVVSALLISAVSAAFSELVVPLAKRRGDLIMAADIEGRTQRDSNRYRKELHYQGEGNRVYYAEKYDKTLNVLVNAVVQEYDGPRLVRRIDARKIFWDGRQWVFINGAIREFDGDTERITTFENRPMPSLVERPEDLAKEEVDPEEMNWWELRDYIDKVRRGGGPVDKYKVDLYFKFSFPFTNLIFAVIGVALSSAKRKPSMATGFGLTLLVSFTYYGILRIGQALGHSGVIPPLLGAWAGNILFLAVGGVLLHRANR
ncbi:MAG: LptF/LptG family permease [Candidatus Krumholzibacteriota bacterium]|nr:LptF/LptG family permease [Candidatus Krumholzibacteriota bacterium]